MSDEMLTIVQERFERGGELSPVLGQATVKLLRELKNRREAAPEITEAMVDMICEAHPWLEWPHDDCAGPGCPPSAAMTLMKRRERSLQIGMQSRDTIIVDLRERVLELESGKITKAMEKRVVIAILKIVPEAYVDEAEALARAALTASVGRQRG